MSYDRLTSMVKEEIGVGLPPNKRLMVESRLKRRILTLGLPDLDAYLDHVFVGGALSEERDVIFDAVTTNKTDFFREPEHFRILASKIIPARRKGGGEAFKIWSAAASTGAEAWTIAMVCAEATQDGPLDWRILGTDINKAVLDVAELAIYDDNQLAPVPPHFATRWLMRGTGDSAGQSRIHPQLRQRVHFQRLNLMGRAYPVDRDVDVIFLRNVLIYFDAEDQARVLHQLAEHLAPGGYLIVGHSESMVVRGIGLTQKAPAVYRKD
ncbi:CheR family methyltransferase [Acuticoccus kandeliae]|uniref:CheR family methyltransferase n=1 Tax=Acuticoccus kandeliae TaxID=2073160 RepID=UPI000D3E8EFD|nr:CheR family methyltransferase [Acuticoccus kandeliae]